MGKLDRSHLIEAGVWLLFFIVFFIASFEFNQPIEIYKFGATGWPRTVLLLLLLVLGGNIAYGYYQGHSIQQGRVGIADDESEKTPYDLHTFFRVIAALGVPFVYALSLKPVGFYSATPFFIAAIVYIFGERNLRRIIIVTISIYVIIMLIFMVILNAPLPQGNMSPFYDFSAFMLRMNTRWQQMGLW